ncbi:hypothetical protein HORIV_12490 [Vreelandella olivaria]|uniref:DUF1330 domain-containing protein n=1 Tax=Vreelandella olivaria TaxID=390919 RepID=A0ABM7GDQ8_9GAMM|nr:hypothetical protein HORIV_12490 [Halomonas olivaria]
MPAYVVLTREHTHDAKEMERYGEKAKAAREGHDPQPLAFYGDFEVLEGSAMEGAVILRFRIWLPPAPGTKAPPTRKPASTVFKEQTTASLSLMA